MTSSRTIRSPGFKPETSSIQPSISVEPTFLSLADCSEAILRFSMTITLSESLMLSWGMNTREMRRISPSATLGCMIRTLASMSGFKSMSGLSIRIFASTVFFWRSAL